MSTETKAQKEADEERDRAETLVSIRFVDKVRKMRLEVALTRCAKEKEVRYRLAFVGD